MSINDLLFCYGPAAGLMVAAASLVFVAFGGEMVDPIPDYRIYVVEAPTLTQQPTGCVFVQDAVVHEFIRMCTAEGHSFRILYLLNIYPKPMKSTDMVAAMMRGQPIP